MTTFVLPKGATGLSDTTVPPNGPRYIVYRKNGVVYVVILFDNGDAIEIAHMPGGAETSKFVHRETAGGGRVDFRTDPADGKQTHEVKRTVETEERDTPAGKVTLPKAFADIRFLMTRYEPGNDLHRAMFEAFRKVFGAHVAEHPIEMTRAVEQSGRFLSSVYEIDYREMTRETWRRARASFDRAYEEFKGSVIAAWDKI